VNTFCFVYFCVVIGCDTKEGSSCCCCSKQRSPSANFHSSNNFLVPSSSGPLNLTLDSLRERKSEDSESSPIDPLPNEIQMIQSPRTIIENKHNPPDLQRDIQNGKTEEDLPTVTIHRTRMPHNRLAININTPSGSSETSSMTFHSPKQKSDSDSTPRGLPGGIETGEFPQIMPSKMGDSFFGGS